VVVDRRTILKTSAAIARCRLFPVHNPGRGETPVRIGMVDPLTGVYAALALNEVVEPNSLPRRSTRRAAFWPAGRTPGRRLGQRCRHRVQKTRKLIDRDQVSSSSAT